MVEQVSSFNAKTHMSKLLVKVEHGMEFIITRHNHAVARLVPMHNKNRSINDVVLELKKRRKQFTLNKEVTINALKSGGRK